MRAYYSLLKEKFSSKSAILTEMINLEAICHLPKGTEHFVSDLHGEYAAFDYILRTGSGTIQTKLFDCFEVWQEKQLDMDEFCHYIYYPEEKIALDSQNLSAKELEKKLLALVTMQIRAVQYMGQKYTRSKVRKCLSSKFSYIIEELLAEIERNADKEAYFQAILQKIAGLGQVPDLVTALSYTIQSLAVDVLHIVGDLYDRGLYPDYILDRLEQIPNVDIQWGNHDVTWLGAVAGSEVCMINVIRIAARYNNLELIEDRYGINLRKLIDYSRTYYQPLSAFNPILDEGEIAQTDKDLLNCVQQATAVLQFKLETQLINRRPEFQLEHRDILSKIDYENQTALLNGNSYQLTNFNPVCIDPLYPSQLSEEEELLLAQLLSGFQTSERLARHARFLVEKGAMYLRYNGNLLFHGCIPLDENGDFKAFQLGETSYAGRALLDFYEQEIRKSYRHPERHTDFETDLFWYLWVGEHSSLFGKKAMTTFERYYIEDKESHKEIKNAYYRLRNEEEVCRRILREFDVSEEGHIINGHTPVREKDGENPIKANTRMLVIDGGFAKGYQKKTGVAGYTLVSNSYGLLLIPHSPFISSQEVLSGNYEFCALRRLVEEAKQRILVKDTNIGHKLQQEIKDLEYLYQHFESY